VHDPIRRFMGSSLSEFGCWSRSTGSSNGHPFTCGYSLCDRFAWIVKFGVHSRSNLAFVGKCTSELSRRQVSSEDQ